MKRVNTAVFLRQCWSRTAAHSNRWSQLTRPQLFRSICQATGKLGWFTKTICAPMGERLVTALRFFWMIPLISGRWCVKKWWREADGERGIHPRSHKLHWPCVSLRQHEDDTYVCISLVNCLVHICWYLHLHACFMCLYAFDLWRVSEYLNA